MFNSAPPVTPPIVRLSQRAVMAVTLVRGGAKIFKPRAAAVGQLVIARHALRSQLRDLRKKLRADFLAILTPEQKAKLNDLKRLRPGRRGQP